MTVFAAEKCATHFYPHRICCKKVHYSLLAPTVCTAEKPEQKRPNGLLGVLAPRAPLGL